jgi:hypothetical protein
MLNKVDPKLKEKVVDLIINYYVKYNEFKNLQTFVKYHHLKIDYSKWSQMLYHYIKSLGQDDLHNMYDLPAEAIKNLTEQTYKLMFDKLISLDYEAEYTPELVKTLIKHSKFDRTDIIQKGFDVLVALAKKKEVDRYVIGEALEDFYKIDKAITLDSIFKTKLVLLLNDPIGYKPNELVDAYNKYKDNYNEAEVKKIQKIFGIRLATGEIKRSLDQWYQFLINNTNYRNFTYDYYSQGRITANQRALNEKIMKKLDAALERDLKRFKIPQNFHKDIIKKVKTALLF